MKPETYRVVQIEGHMQNAVVKRVIAVGLSESDAKRFQLSFPFSANVWYQKEN